MNSKIGSIYHLSAYVLYTYLGLNYSRIDEEKPLKRRFHREVVDFFSKVQNLCSVSKEKFQCIRIINFKLVLPKSSIKNLPDPIKVYLPGLYRKREKYIFLL